MQQMPRRRQGHLNNGGGMDCESGCESMGEEKSTSVASESYNYLHKKFKKAEALTTTAPNNDSASKSANPSLEALFQVTGHELQKIQSSNGVEVPVNEEERKKGHVCPYCGIFWGKPSVLQKHIRAHTNERPYPCLTCGFAFKTKSNLYKHCKTRAHHQKANNDSCELSSNITTTCSPPPPVSSSSTTAVEAMDTDESDMDEDNVEVEPQSAATNHQLTATVAHSTAIYKPKFHSVNVNEAGTNNDVGDKSPKLATPEFLQQHITKLISQNAAIVDTFDSSWPQRYKRQASVPANVHLAEVHSLSSSSKERLRHLSEDGGAVHVNDSEIMEIKSKNCQNPEGSIIKDLLLKTRMSTTPSGGSCIRLCGGSVELSNTSQPAPSSSLCATTADTGAEETFLYMCHRCHINFKSSENLDAHKRHYCHPPHPPPRPSSASSSSQLRNEMEIDLNVAQTHKPRGRPKGSKNRPKKEESRSHSKSMSEGSCEEVVSRITSSRRNSIALGEGTDSIKDILTSVKWAEESSEGSSNNNNNIDKNPDGPILKKHLLQGFKADNTCQLPIKKHKFEFDSLSSPNKTKSNNSVHLYGGEVEILDEGSGATKRIVIDSQFYNGQQQNETKIEMVAAATSSSVVATIAKPVHNSGGTVLQVQESSTIRSTKVPPVCIQIPSSSAAAAAASSSANNKKSELVLSAVSRPTSLALNSSLTSMMMGTTLVSPETPRPKRKYGQCYFNGQYYTYLELKHSTRVYYCCIYRPQPMYIPQLNDTKLSMYSVWQTVPPTPDPFGFTPSRAMALYNSTNHHSNTNCFYSTAPRSTVELTLTHSSYWMFQQQKKEGEKVSTISCEKEIEKRGVIVAIEVEKSSSAGAASNKSVKLSEEYTYVRGRGRGKYICHECGIRCKKPSMLKKHVRTHTDVRPYTCKHCNFSFKTKGNLTKHMKSKAHHKKCVEMGIVPVPITIDDAQIDEEAVERQERIEHQRKQFANDEDSEIDEDEEEEDEEEEYDEDGLSQVHFKEGEDEEEDEDLEDAEGQFDDATEEPTLNKKSHSDQEMVARSLLDLGQQKSLKCNLLPEVLDVVSSKEMRCADLYRRGIGGSECEQPIDLSMPHAQQRAHQHEDVAEEEDEEVDNWSDDDCGDIVVDDDQPPAQQQQPHLEGGGGKKLVATNVPNTTNNPWPNPALVRPSAFKSGSNSCQPTPGVTQIFPSGSSVLPRPQTLNSYINRSMEDGKCVCTICNKLFSKPSQLRLHLNIHYFERPFRCDSCAISFRTKGHLQKHRRSVSHYNKVNMNMTFGTPTTDNPRPFKCPDCKIAFRIHGHLAKHLRSKMHIMKLECLGKLPFGTYAEIERSGVNLNEIDTTDCENSLESLQVMAHRLVDKGSPPSNVSWTRERTISGGSCDDHSDGLPYVAKSGSEEDLSRPLVAPMTGGGGGATAAATPHKNVLATQDYEDISEDEEQVAFRCHLCGKRVKSAKFLQVHMYVDHSDNNNEATSTSVPPPPLMKSGAGEVERVDSGSTPKNESEVSCELCGELCSSQQDLSQHLLSHARCRPFICNLCDAAFTSIHYLKIHLVTHQQGIMFGCKECGGSFSSVGELELHMDRRHGVESVR